MARVKGALNSRRRHKKILKLAKGYYGSKSKQYRTAKAAVMRAQRAAYIGRRRKKRDFRKLWIARINAACRLNDISYSRFMYGLKQGGIDLNRKVLADIAVADPAGFTELVNKAKAAEKGETAETSEDSETAVTSETSEIAESPQTAEAPEANETSDAAETASSAEAAEQ